MPRRTNSDASTALWVSQNYLTSARTIGRLLDLTSLAAADHVIEIGPGKGHITAALLARCGRVTAVELDGRLFTALEAKLASAANLDLHRGDFLDWSLPRSGEYKVFSNIPFSRTTDIVRRLAECCNPPAEMWLVMEKGAARRFMGKPRESLRSLVLKPWFTMDIAYHFRREDFHPLPHVDIVLLHLARKPVPDIPPAMRPAYEAFITGGLNRGLRGLAAKIPKGRLAAALRETGVAPGAAPGDVLYVQWLCLYRCWRAGVSHPAGNAGRVDMI
jgi:23S rRNA (adenine-N6)-dimethyltransferase